MSSSRILGLSDRVGPGWVLPVSLLLALLLGLVPLPGMLQPLRPYWLALVLAYWLLEEHEQVGLGVAFALGVVADLVFGERCRRPDAAMPARRGQRLHRAWPVAAI